MAYLWIRELPASWTPHPLPPAPAAVDLGRLLLPADAALHPAVQLLSRNKGSATGEYFLLLSPLGSSVCVSGAPLRAGCRLVRDRDSIRLGNHLAFLSTETPPVVEPFHAGESPQFCPRCKATLEDGALACACPGCGSSYHASEARPCFDYAPTCAVCGHATVMSDEFQWTPEAL